MPRRVLRASTTGIERARRALQRLGLTQKDLTIDPCIAAWATINGFFNGKAIDHSIFKEICFHLGLEWQEIYEPPPDTDPAPPAASEVQAGSQPQPSPLVEPSLLLAVRQQAIAAREALTPRILERIPRSVVREKYLPAIARGLSGEQQRVIPIVAPAGYGKSTILGDLYDELTEADTPWVGLILCSTLSLSTGFLGFMSYSYVAATFAMPTQPSGDRNTAPLSSQMSLLDAAFGKSLCGMSQPIVDVVHQLTILCGRGVLLIDTLDLVINREFVVAFSTILRQLLDHGVTVVFTCRDHDYNDYLEPTRERLIGLSHAIDRHSVPNFTTAEIRAAAERFFAKLEPTTPERGQAFADNILNLSADNRSLQDIIQNPLLLALLCDLFAQDGTVPPDLTVSKLYQRYWQEKIAYSRIDQSHFASLAIEKDNLCLILARVLFERSQERLCESLYRDDLGIQFTEIVVNAYNDLLSEGVIDVLPSRKLHFFHQTLLEYAIAYWLTRHTAQTSRDQLFAALNQPDATLAKTYWLPVLRQLLTIVDEEEFEICVAQLDIQNLGIFGVVAIAAASRDCPDSLRRLLPTALELGESYQRRLRQALEAASRPLIENTWDMLLTLLEQAEHSTAGNTAQLAGELMARWWQALKLRLPETLAAIARRSLTVAGQNYQDQGDRALLLGWFLYPCLPLLEQAVDPALLASLQQYISLMGHRTCATVIRLHTHPNVPAPVQHALLEQLSAVPIPNYEDTERALCDFLTSLLPHHLTSSNFPLGTSWSEILYCPLPDQWDVVQAKAVGRWAARDEIIFSAVLNDFLDGNKEHLRRNLIALTESVDWGSAPTLMGYLLQTAPASLTVEHYKRLSPLLIRSVRSLTPDEQEHLTHWLQPQVERYIQYLHPTLDALADVSPLARQLLERSLEQLPTKKQAQIRNQLLRFHPIDCHPPLTTLDQASQKFLISFYQQQAANNPLALDRLLKASQCHIREVALLASSELDQTGGDNLKPTQLLPLLQSIFPGVRVNALIGMTRLEQYRHSLQQEEVTHVCQVLLQDDNQTVARHLCIFIAIWVRQQQQVPLGILTALAEIPTKLSKQDLFEGGTARAMMDALKAIAQSEERSLDLEALGQVVRRLLMSIHIIQVRNSESEMIDLLSAMNRLDRQFLATVIQEDSPLLVRQGWIRNVVAVVKTIRRVENHHSALLNQVLAEDWCTPEIRSAILEVRGG